MYICRSTFKRCIISVRGDPSGSSEHSVVERAVVVYRLCLDSKDSDCFLTRLLRCIATTFRYFCFATCVISDESWGQVVDPLLMRPEWQLRADLEFDLACRNGALDLCREVLKTIQSDPSSTQAQELLGITIELLEIQQDEPPKVLPKQPASVTYLEHRKAAVSELFKTYKSKGRELPKATIDREKHFYETQKLALAPLIASEVGLADGSTSEQAGASRPRTMDIGDISRKPIDVTDPELIEMATEVTGRDSSTIKSVVATINALNEYRTRKFLGTTTAEKQVAEANESKALQAFIEKQPDWTFTYPIRDVSLGSKSIKLEVEDPIELKLLNQEFLNILVMKSLRDSLELTDPALLRKWRSIKPGQLLRIRVKAGAEIKRTSKPEVRVGKEQLISVFERSANNEYRYGDPVFMLMATELIDAKILRALQSPTSGPP